MNAGRLRRTIFVLLLLISLVALIWGLWPLGMSAKLLPVSPRTGLVSTPQITQAPPAIQEQRLLVLEWPVKMRLGDSDVIRLSFEMDERGLLTPTVEISGHTTGGQPVEIPDLYQTHSVQAQARLDVSGMNVSPQGNISQALLPGEQIAFFWSVHPEEVGNYRGTVWFGLRFLPRDGGEAIEKTISAQILEIECINFLGLSGAAARIAGGIGIAISSLLGWEEIVKFGRMLFKHLTTTRSEATR